MDENWWRSLAWMDYRLAVLFTVLLPLVLLVLALVQKRCCHTADDNLLASC